MNEALAVRADTTRDEVKTALHAVYNWNYNSELDQIRTLYANGLERQWIAVRDLDWSRGIDRQKFADTFSLAGAQIQKTDFWKNLDPGIKWEVARRTSAFQLSNFLHGEQGALMVAAQMVNAVPHMDAKFYAATQTVDEARHVEVFAAYIKLLDEIYDVDISIRNMLDEILATDSWMKKAVGMQVVLEGLALYIFRDMRNATEEPLLKQLLTFVSRDEARHTGYGIKYLTRLLPDVGDAERRELEDFAFEGSRVLIGSRNGPTLRESVFKLWREAGLDPALALQELARERDKLSAGAPRGSSAVGPIRGFIIPTMKSIGLWSDRLAGFYRDLFAAHLGEEQRNALHFEAELPADLEAWVQS